MKYFGVALDLSEAGVVKGYIDPLQPFHRGGIGTEAANGVIIAGLFDLVVGLTGFVQGGLRRAAVAQLNIQYLKPLIGNRLQVVGRPTKSGKNLVFVAAELIDERGAVCARADGITVLVDGEPISNLEDVAI